MKNIIILAAGIIGGIVVEKKAKIADKATEAFDKIKSSIHEEIERQKKARELANIAN